MKTYIVFSDGRVGYIKNICKCEKCKERGEAEIFINDLDDGYLDCIKANDVEDIIYFGESLNKAIEEENDAVSPNPERIAELQEKFESALTSMSTLASQGGDNTGSGNRLDIRSFD